MKNLFNRASLALLMIFGLSVSASAESLNVKSVIETGNSAWNQNLNTGNAKALSNLYTDNATLSPGNGKVLVGRAEIEKLFTSFVENGVHDHALEVITVGGEGNMMYQVSKWSAKGAVVDGKAPAFGGVTTSVLVKGADGKWLIQSHVWNLAD